MNGIDQIRRLVEMGSKSRESEALFVETSEDALANEFVDRYGDKLRFSPGMGWMINRGTHWEPDRLKERFDLARSVARRNALSCNDSRAGVRISSAKTVAAILMMAETDPRVALPACVWDADHFALNTPGGIVDLRTGKLRLNADEYHTRVTRVAPSAQVAPIMWSKFIREVFVDDQDLIEFVQRLLGYCLTGDRREQKLFFFYGLGANGKSTLIDLVQRLLGPYSVKLPASVLMQSRSERHPTEIAQLQGRRLAVSSELDEGAYWAEARIKELTGDETVSARFMRQDFFEFALTQKHVIVGNFKPRMHGGDAALARRITLVPFLARFEGSARDPKMTDRLWSEAPAILAWLIEGAVKWSTDGLAIPSTVVAASAEYMSDNDDVAQWRNECCDAGPEFEGKGGDLYASFSQWIRARGQQVPSAKLWSERMLAVPSITKRQSNGARYRGVRLKCDELGRVANFGTTHSRSW